MGGEHEAALSRVVRFGKYKNDKITYMQIIERDENYAKWLATKCDITPDDVREALLDYLGDEL